MSIEGQKFYPGEAATPRQILLLANEYRRAADALREMGRRGKPLSRAPYRMVAIQAIELYLNALLLAAGHEAGSLRGMRHDLATRAELTLETKLRLRQRTLTHLRRLSETREYLITRYDPAPAAASQVNRLAATLTEVAEKVAKHIEGPAEDRRSK